MTLPTWREWLFSAKAFSASMLALYIALSLDLPRPYWAMAAVYIVANPLAGATSSKGIYRALGTLLGAVAAVFFVPIFVNAPILLCLVVALWTGVMLSISLLDRGPRGYVFMLAGYSLPLIAFPTVGAPEGIFDVAVARSEEILIGITCASIVGAVLFPTSVATALTSRMTVWLDDAALWAKEIMQGEGALPVTSLARQKLAADVAGIDPVISQLAYDAATRDIGAQARELRGRLLMLLPLLSSLADRLYAIGTQEGALSPHFSAVLARASVWIGRNADPDEADRLIAECKSLRSGDLTDWNGLIQESAVDRLNEVVALWGDCLAVLADIQRGQRSAPQRFRYQRIVAPARHRDLGLLLFSAVSCSLAILCICAFWIAAGWANGGTAAMMTAVACSFFAATDRPAPLIRSFAVWTGVSLLASSVYLFIILPNVHGFEMLALVFAPPFLLLGLLIPRPQFNMLGMLLTVNTASFVALQNRYNVDFPSFVNEGLAAMIGVTFSYVWTVVTRPFGAEIVADRLLRAGWRDISEIAAGHNREDPAHLAGRMLDRLGQLVPRLSAMKSGDLAKIDGFAELRIGLNVVELRQGRRMFADRTRLAIDAVLASVAALYRERAARRRLIAPPAALREEIDDALQLAVRETAPAGRSAVDALAGLRRALFSSAAGPTGLFGRRNNLPRPADAAE